jgi:hypothetical protein
MDLRQLITKRVREAMRDGKAAGANIAAAVNIGQDGHTTAVYSDDEVTIVQRDGETTVTRRDGQDQT